ncbi:MAG TPA: Ppx/GppA phosphatase family protein [Solirubrobacteraceae bacterium]|jgi:exopolyphosphatase/guanosine-5'-triphosphate,3'-diphosphate pyrophosphatase|nr:Ppx/GppA phosphatase family protein [Solirubrobacteraceae bacterium]
MSWRTTRASAQSGVLAKHVAVIDLGSNSWRLVVFSYGSDGWWKRTDELYESVRIAEGMGDSGRLQEAAMERGLETLAVFERFCRASRLTDDEVHAVATSAIRDAINREEFLERASRQGSFEIEVLSAEAEAHYGYVAAINTSTLTDGVILDIGGGSLQLTEVAGRQERSVISVPLGAVRMTERFLCDPGPARKKDLQKLRAHVKQTLSDLPWLAEHGGRLVGTGGAVRNLAAADGHAGLGPNGGIDLGVQGYVVTREALKGLVTQLAGLPAADRAAVEGIKPGRADIILAAAVTLETVLDLGGFEGIEATEAGLRDGLFLARTLLSEERPLFANVRQAAVRNLAIQYESDLHHTEHVARLALQMHESLAENGLFEPQPGESELLWAAGMLHDVGMTISYDDHHKHSRYLIVSAELPGFDPRERALIAQMTRYHRKGAPKLGPWAKLGRPGDEEMLERCAVILRLAEHLERGRDQSVSQASLRTNGDGIALHLHAAGDLTLPRWSVERYGDDEAFQKVFRRPLVIG